MEVYRCSHKQAEYDSLTDLITKDQQDCDGFVTIKEFVDDMKTKHEELNVELKSAIGNLENNTLIANKKIDEGLIEDDYNEIEQFILQCDEVSKKCKSKIDDLNESIISNTRKRNRLSGKCWNCWWNDLFSSNAN